MHELWSATSYAPDLLSLPFAFAPAAMLIVIAYAAVMRGAPVPRGFLLAHCLALLPYAIVVMLSPSIRSPMVADRLFRIAAATIPLAAAAGLGFQLALVGSYRRYRRIVWLAIATAGGWFVATATSDATVGGVDRIVGLWYPVAGKWAWLAVVDTLVVSLGGFVALGYVAITSPPSDERRQIRAMLVANAITYAGLLDVALAYGVGVFPVGWLLSGIGSLLVVRALVVENLLRVRAVDTTAPLLVVHFVGGVLLAWAAVVQLGRDAPWWVQLVTIVIAQIGVRLTIKSVGLLDRGARSRAGPLDRLLAQLVARSRSMTTPPPIARLAIDVVDLGIGARPEILISSEDDWGWTTADGEPVTDRRAPDPVVASWLAQQRELRAVFADDLEPVPADLRVAMRTLFVDHAARAIILVRSADELLGVIAVPVATRLRGRQLEFLERAAERLAEALVHARMANRASERAAIAREVELAATVQRGLLPDTAPHVHGDVTVVGAWQPATRCAGDFWGVYPLGGGRVLVAIGDVTGHGVASAMVAAAAVGACEVCVRRDPGGLDLGDVVAALDAAVRRVGGGELSMTCFAAILDPEACELRFVSCGHPTPYLCRATGPDEPIELHALVGRGNPLGSREPAEPRVLHRPLHAGDLIVCYTDGVTEAIDGGGAPYGDRRLQRLLRRLDRGKLAPAIVHDIVQAAVAAHRAGRPPADDETVVIAQFAVQRSAP